MSKGARNKDLELSAGEKKQFDELVALLAKRGFGEGGPPRETTFAQIEEFGHQAGQMVARAIDARLAEQHAAHFAGEEPCPSCGEKHLPNEDAHDLELQTEDGEVKLREPAFHCPPCERDFFPSTHPVAD
jgi:DNA repair exonuclease SbcCD ATPase subunit